MYLPPFFLNASFSDAGMSAFHPPISSSDSATSSSVDDDDDDDDVFTFSRN